MLSFFFAEYIKRAGRNKRQRIPKGQSKMDNTEKLTIFTQDEDKQNKNTTQYVLDNTLRKKTIA